MDKDTEQKILQVVNLSPSEDWIEKIIDTHPMKQVAVMTLVQVVVFGSMFAMFGIIDLGLALR